jgi:hypothetical protein
MRMRTGGPGWAFTTNIPFSIALAVRDADGGSPLRMPASAALVPPLHDGLAARRAASAGSVLAVADHHSAAAEDGAHDGLGGAGEDPGVEHGLGRLAGQRRMVTVELEEVAALVGLDGARRLGEGLGASEAGQRMQGRSGARFLAGEQGVAPLRAESLSVFEDAQLAGRSIRRLASVPIPNRPPAWR